MALTVDSNFPPSGPAPYFINREWCIGDSLIVLNNNFDNLDSRILGLSSIFPLKVDSIDDQAIEKTKLVNSTPLSVIGRPQNSLGTPSDIVASTDGHVLRRSGTSIGFGQIGTTAIAARAVTGGGSTGSIAEKTITAYNIADGTITNDKLSTSSAARIDGTKITPGFGNQDIITSGRLSINSSTPQGGLYIKEKEVRYTPTNRLPGTTYPPDSDGSNGFNAVIHGTGVDSGGLLVVVGDNNGDEKALDVWNLGLPDAGVGGSTPSINSVGGPSRKFMVQSNGNTYVAGNIRTDGRISVGGGNTYYGGLYTANQTTTFIGPNDTQGATPGTYSQLTIDGYPGSNQLWKTIGAVIRNTGSDAGGLLIIVGDNNGDESALDVWNSTSTVRGLKFRIQSNGATSGLKWSNLSDRNKKTEIENTTINGIDFINKFRVVDYLWKETAETDKNKNIGLIAQEVEEIYPASVSKSGEEYYLDYINIIGPLIKASQELSQLVKEQQRVIEDQQKNIEELKTSITNLQAKL